MKSFREHLKERGLTDNVCCWIDDEQELVSFPLFNLTGELIGYQKYNWKCEKIRDNYGRYYTFIGKKYRPEKRTHPIVFWGMEYFKECDYGDILFVTEGVWDAVRVIEAGYTGIAILCNDPNKQFVQWFKMISSHVDTVGLLDNGEAGQKLRKIVKRSVDLPVHDFNSFKKEDAIKFLNNVSSLTH